MLSHQGKRLQARKLSAELAAMARTKERDDVSRCGCGLRYTGTGPRNKNQENHRGKQQGVTRS